METLLLIIGITATFATLLAYVIICDRVSRLAALSGHKYWKWMAAAIFTTPLLTCMLLVAEKLIAGTLSTHDGQLQESMKHPVKEPQKKVEPNKTTKQKVKPSEVKATTSNQHNQNKKGNKKMVESTERLREPKKNNKGQRINNNTGVIRESERLVDTPTTVMGVDLNTLAESSPKSGN